MSDAGDVDEVKVLADFSLDKLDPTQRVFADRVLKWGDELVDVHETVKRDGRGMVGDKDHPLHGVHGMLSFSDLSQCRLEARR